MDSETRKRFTSKFLNVYLDQKVPDEGRTAQLPNSYYRKNDDEVNKCESMKKKKK